MIKIEHIYKDDHSHTKSKGHPSTVATGSIDGNTVQLSRPWKDAEKVAKLFFNQYPKSEHCHVAYGYKNGSKETVIREYDFFQNKTALSKARTQFRYRINKTGGRKIKQQDWTGRCMAAVDGKQKVIKVISMEVKTDDFSMYSNKARLELAQLGNVVSGEVIQFAGGFYFLPTA